MTAVADAEMAFDAEAQAAFRGSVRRFLDHRLPHYLPLFEEAGSAPEFWKEAGALGFLGLAIPSRHGGSGAGARALIIVSEELGRNPLGASFGALLSMDIVTCLLAEHGSEDQIARWAPGIFDGTLTQCMAITEPDAGSDVSAIRCTARRDGDGWIINGAKCYISGGAHADLIYALANSGGSDRRELSFFIIQRGLPGVSQRRMKTMGFAAGDVGELHFDNVRVTADHLLGSSGQGMSVAKSAFLLDRVQISVRSLAAAQTAFDLTRAFVRQRKAFGQRVFDFQNTQFRLAEMHTELTVGRAFLDALLLKLEAGELTMADSAMAKLWLTELEGRVLDQCVQLHGGAGFMDEMPISRMYSAARVQRLYGGTSEMQKIAIARVLDHD